MDIKNKFKEFSLSSFSVDNSTSILLLAIMVLIFGISSYNNMPKEQFPEASFPTVYINTPYFGNSAEEIENLITRPLEKEIESINGIKKVTSTSIQDFSVIIAEFDTGIDMESVVRKVKDAVDKAKSELPTDLDQDPTVLEINLSEIPIVSVNISGRYSADELREYGEYLQDRLEEIKQISDVNLKGTLDREVKVDVDLIKAQAVKVSYSDIENAISSENLTMSAGEISAGDFKRAVRVVGQFDTAEQIANIIVKSEAQRPIYLKDIAEVEFGYKDRTSYARADGLPVVSLDVIKRKGENLLAAADRVKEVVNDAKSVLPNDLKITLFNDQSINTRNEVSNLENSIISGVILVVLVLLFFLGIKNASFVGLAIPLSMLMGIMFLSLTGATMNIVVLFSLILALGMLVDNAIVVVENMYRFMQNGYNATDAAKFGTGEVAIPIIASTATTVAAFLPLAFWPGIMGEFMQYMPLTLIIVLSSSLIVALVVNPVVAAKFMSVEEKVEDAELKERQTRSMFKLLAAVVAIGLIGHMAGAGWLRNLAGFGVLMILANHYFLRPASFYFQERILTKLESGYSFFIRRALSGKMPGIIFAGTFGLLVLAIVLLGIRAPRVIFFPEADPIYINAFIELPLGSDIEATNRIVKDVENKIEQVITSKRQIVESVLTQIGEETSDPNSPPEPGVTPHKARVTISFVPSQDRGGISTRELLNEIREEVQSFAGVEIVIDQNANGPPAGKPINLEIRGENIDTLIVTAANLKNHINQLGIPGIEELKTDVNIGKPEMMIEIDREAARRYELSTYSIAMAIRTSVFGKEVSKYKVGEDEYPIMVRLDENSRNNVEDLLNQRITFRNPANGKIVQVPISAVAKVSFSSTYNAIKRKNSFRVATIFSNVLDGYNANEIVEELKAEMANYPLPKGFTYEFTGEQQQQAEDMSFLGGAFIVALFIIFIIIVAQFNSLISPFIIMLTVFFSTIGVFLGYVVSGDDISVIFSGVGIISLAGIVVNNAIVLIDYTNLIMDRKLKELGLTQIRELSYDQVREALIEGGATRLRPVLLTAITTVLGLIPLAIGLNINFFTLVSEFDPQIFIGGDNTAIWGPLAWTVIYGLVFATFLTLVVVPVMYWLAIKGRRFARAVVDKVSSI